MLALIVLDRYGRYHVLIVWLQDLKYAQGLGKAVAQRNQRGRMHTPAPRAPVLRVSRVTYPGAGKCISAVRADLRQLLAGLPDSGRRDPVRLRTRGQRHHS